MTITITAILSSVLFVTSELLPFIKGVKSNGILDFILDIFRKKSKDPNPNIIQKEIVVHIDFSSIENQLIDINNSIKNLNKDNTDTLINI